MSDYAKNLLDTISLIANDAVSKAQFDKTIQAVIVSCEDQAAGIYKVRYQDSIWLAYSSDLTITYSPDTSVYVLIPGNNMAKTKTIIGSVNTLGKDYVQYINDEDTLLQNGDSVVSYEDSEDTETGLCSYRDEEKILYDESVDGTQILKVDGAAASEYLQGSSHIMIQADFRTNLPKQHRRAGNYGIKASLQFVNPDGEENIVRDYVLDIDSMVGNPYLFTSSLTQREYFQIDAQNFIKIKQISIFDKDFVNEVVEGEYEDDIFISNIQLYGMNQLTLEQKQGLSLRFKRSQGYIFNSNDSPTTTKQVVAQLRSSGKLISTTFNKVQFYWFMRDAAIQPGNEQYSKYGGKGWRCLNPENTQETNDDKFLPASQSFVIKKQDVSIQKVQFKCTVIYNNIEVSKTFEMLNLDSEYNIEITSDKQEIAFFSNEDELTLTCVVSKSSGTLPELTYSWKMATDAGTIYGLGQTQSITVKAENVRRYNDYYCAVYSNNMLIGTASLRIFKKVESNTRYLINIVNGTQLFNYDEAGNSPYNEAAQVFLTIPTLTFEIVDTVTENVYSGDTIRNIVDSYVWTFPLENSLLVDENIISDADPEIQGQIDVEEEQVNPDEEIIVDGQVIVEQDQSKRTYTNLRNFVYGISSRYYANKTNNVITLDVKIHNETFSTQTNFMFTKQGQSGTNGTGIVCRIGAYRGAYAQERIRDWLVCRVDNPDFESPNPPETYNWDYLIPELWKDGEKINLDINSMVSEQQIKWEMLSNRDFSWYSVSLVNEIPEEGFNNYGGATVTLNQRFLSGSSFQSFNALWGRPANILKLSITYNGRIYYDTVPIVTIYTLGNVEISLKSNCGFKYVVYSEDGENPDYDDLTPFEVQSNQTNLYWRVVGSIRRREALSSLDGGTFVEETGNLIQDSVRNYIVDGTTRTRINSKMAYYKPNSIYDGLCVSNALIVKKALPAPGESATPEEYCIHIPIHFMLNRYGHKNLNDWDGNSISIDNEGGFILSPQVGAGQKQDDNTFTGVLMGTVTNVYNEHLKEIGLFGYNKGARTIFLDAESGKAQFGVAGKGQITIDPSEDTGKIYGGNYVESNGTTIGSGMLIDLTTPEIKFGSGNFHVDANGELTAQKGKIGPWNLVSSALYYDSSSTISSPRIGNSDSNDNYIYIGIQGLSLGKNFIYNAASGNLTLNVKSLAIGGSDIAELYGGSGKNLFNKSYLSYSTGVELLEDWTADYKYTGRFTTEGAYFYIRGVDIGLKDNIEYTVSFHFVKKDINPSDRLENIKIFSSGDVDFISLTLDGEIKTSVQVPLNDNTSNHQIEYIFKKTSSISETNIYIQFNSGSLTPVAVQISRVMVEEGKGATGWEPSSQDLSLDVTEARKQATNYLYYRSITPSSGLYISHTALTDSNFSSRSQSNIRLTGSVMQIYAGQKLLASYGDETIFYGYDTGGTQYRAATLGTGGLSILKGTINLGTLSNIDSRTGFPSTGSGFWVDSSGKMMIGQLVVFENGLQYRYSSDGNINTPSNIVYMLPGRPAHDDGYGNIITDKALGLRVREGSNWREYFYVNYDGFLHAQNVDITGKITANSGQIANFYITKDDNQKRFSLNGHLFATSLYSHLTVTGSSYSSEQRGVYEVGLRGDVTSPHAAAIYIARMPEGATQWDTTNFIFKLQVTGKMVAKNAEITGIIHSMGKTGYNTNQSGYYLDSSGNFGIRTSSGDYLTIDNTSGIVFSKIRFTGSTVYGGEANIENNGDASLGIVKCTELQVGPSHTTDSSVSYLKADSSGTYLYEVERVYTPGAMYIQSDGRVTVHSSSLRYKDISNQKVDITLFYNVSAKMAKYKQGFLPVGHQLENKFMPMLIAEQIDKICPQAVIHNKKGQAENWSEKVLIPIHQQMLVQQHKKIQQLQKEVIMLKKEIKGYENK